jgi:sulfatase maturation enzyme AslB (radical SAM superfamily)
MNGSENDSKNQSTNEIRGDRVKEKDGTLVSVYFDDIKELSQKLNDVSPSFCLAKWYNVSLHIPTGQTHSCYHPRSHKIPLEEVVINVDALHNTSYKKQQRQLMLTGERPKECSFCWEIEDSGNQLSDRAYRSKDVFEEGIIDLAKIDIEHPSPRYLEVNFNQACNFKCTYCSPHLSTAWQKDIEQHGPYKLVDRTHNDLTWLRNVMKPNNGPDNPYLQAFWKWFPTVYPTLKTFRMTGGEPLMDKNTFKVFEYVANNPKKDLHLSITSNCCPPGDQWNKFMTALKSITDKNAIDHFMLYCSLDSWGEQAEYIRPGMDFETLYRNIVDFIKNSDKHSITFIITFNALSYTKWMIYLTEILRLRNTYNTDRQLIWFDIPQLSTPEWLNPKMIPEMVSVLENSIKFMKLFRETPEKRFKGFKDFEISKVQRLIDWIKSDADFDRETQMKNFYLYFSEHDRRRDTSFVEVFPELNNFWNKCKDSYGS